MRWATRAGVHIDRAACAWLIRRLVDPQAQFVFVDDPAEVPADATPFDIRGVELGHHGGDCTFETILCCGGWRRSCTRRTSMTSGSTRRRRPAWTPCCAACR